MKKVDRMNVKNDEAKYVEYGDDFCPNYKRCLKSFMKELNEFCMGMSVMYEITQSDFSHRKMIETDMNVFTLDLGEKKKVNKIVYVPNSDTYLIYLDDFGFATFLKDRIKRYLLLSGNEMKSTYIDSVSDDIYVLEVEVGNEQNIAKNNFFGIKTMTL
jgi:hypothetical protein